VAGLSETEITHVSHHRKPRPLISRRDVIGIAERIDSRGEVIVPVEAREVKVELERLFESGVEALAIGFLWSIRNPVHEELVRRIAEGMAPNLFISTSAEVAPVLGEYERITSAVINSYVGPAIASYTEGLELSLRQAGLAGSLLFMQANGGLANRDAVLRRPLAMLDSGPAAGVLGVAALSHRIPQKHILCADVGGTTFDVGVVSSSRPVDDQYPVIDQFEFRFPKILVKSVGAGGGSIAWLDRAGRLRVGPRSAGAYPGPACYGRGGTEPTVTDAYLMLGCLDPGIPLASGLQLDLAAAEAAVGTLADSLGWDAENVAIAIVRISGNQMGDLLHRVTMEQGIDPRDVALAVYGGAGPLFAAVIADGVGIPSLHVMPEAGTFSAFGMLTTDLVWSIQTPFSEELPLTPERADRMQQGLQNLTAKVREFFASHGVNGESLILQRTARIRFALQAHDLPIPIEEQASSENLRARFIEQYRTLNGANSAYDAAPVETVSLRVTGISPVQSREGTTTVPEATAPSRGSRRVHFPGTGWVETAVYESQIGTRMPPVNGPAIVHAPGNTIVIPPGWSAVGGAVGDLILQHKEAC
jgi:N-methylhydantoinase A